METIPGRAGGTPLFVRTRPSPGCQALLDEHFARNPTFTRCSSRVDRPHKSYIVSSCALQYCETEFAFIERPLTTEGIGTRHTHGPDPDTSLRPADGYESRRKPDNIQKQSDTHRNVLC